MEDDHDHQYHHQQQQPDEPEEPRPLQLPSDLPRSLDDRKSFNGYGNVETEMYDAWQGQSQFLTAPTLARPSNFNLALNEPDDFGRNMDEHNFGRNMDEHDFERDMDEHDSRLAHMLATQARNTKDDSVVESAEDDVVNDKKLSDGEKRQMLQDYLFMAASNGDSARVQRLVRGKAALYVDVNAVDSEGTPPLVYASCFGHKDVVTALLNSGAVVDKQDRNQWSALMWAMTNRHKDIAKLLLDHGASTEIQSSTGRTALDFVAPNSEMSEYLNDSGYTIGNVGVTGDFYDAGFEQDRFEEEMAENEMKRRMMMESAVNLEVDLGNLGLDEQPESPDEFDDSQEFVWDRCLNDQMFVFQENDSDRILNIVVTEMTPQRSPSQKPIPANIIFLGARYAHYHASQELLNEWLLAAQDKIYAVVERHQWDMTMLAFWISNATLLLYYLKKDPGLAEVTNRFQAKMAEQIHEIYILIIRDAERRMDKVLDEAMLDHETIPGFEDITFQNEWKFLRSKPKPKALEPLEKRFRPPSPKRRAQVSPRNVTSLLSSTLFVLDLYDVHSVIATQIMSQLLYWLSAEIFNRIMSNKRYLARTKAMQIRMNISQLEDWARTNNRSPDHFENGSLSASGENVVEAARRHLAPVVQLLQWLQCFSSLGQDDEALDTTLQQLPALSTRQLLHAVKYYRAEVGEKILPKAALKRVEESKRHIANKAVEEATAAAKEAAGPGTPQKGNGSNAPSSIPGTPQSAMKKDEDDVPEGNLLDPALLLPFHLPTSTDMLVTYGAGFGGVNRERERRYTPTVPPDFFTKLDPSGGARNLYEDAKWSDEELGN